VTVMAKVFNALCPPGRTTAMQAIAVKMFKDSMVSIYDELYDFIAGIRKDLGGDEMREDAIINWEKQLGITPAPSDTLQERREMIEASWAIVGSLGPGYIEAALQNAGFDVVVKENLPAVNLTTGTQIEYAAHGGATQSVFSTYGTAQFGQGLDGYFLGNGLLLQNDGTKVDPFVIPTGSGGAPATYYASHGGASQKVFSTYGPSQFGAGIDDWNWVFIIESETGDLAEIPTQRRAAFEREILRLKPAHLGIFIRVRYV